MLQEKNDRLHKRYIIIKLQIASFKHRYNISISTILNPQKPQQYFQLLTPNLVRTSFGNITDPFNSIVATLFPYLQKKKKNQVKLVR